MKRIFLLFAALVSLATTSAAGGKTTLYLVGDSTCATKDLDKQNPERGWGHMLQPFFDSQIVVSNHARNGRSTRSFRDEGLWDNVIGRVGEGDYVFIQFGHNDSKDDHRYSSPAQYAENLRAYVREVRGKDATPVLLTPIVRRKWVDGVLTDTHGEYPAQMKRVAAEEAVTLIDMEAVTREWVAAMGDEGSKPYFMWVEPGTCPLHPDGRQDDTHLNIRGARILAAMTADRMAGAFPELAAHRVDYDYVVAKDGSGDFFTITELVNNLPDFTKEGEVRVLIRNGVYKEKVVIPQTKTFIHFVGESVEGTILTYDDYAARRNAAGKKIGTSGSSSLYICATDFTAENITFDNSAGRVGQAVAVQCIGDHMVFRNCRFTGNQDTLYLYGHGNRDGAAEYVPNARIYLCDCYIEGTTDFIFGSAVAYFERCRIHSKMDSYVTAASSCKGQPYGFVFADCDFTADDGVTRCWLGRPWRNYAQTVIIGCRLGRHILPAGWENWGRREAERTTLYAEYGNTGDGAATDGRVKWAKQLKTKDLARYTREAVLAGTDGWNPAE